MTSPNPEFPLKTILITTSTFPATPTDPVPDFVKNQAIWLHKQHPELAIHVLAPSDAYSKKQAITRHEDYIEYRFHYFIPRWELLAGRGIAPALKNNKFLYFEVPFLFLFEMIATYRMIRKVRPDVVYAHWFTPQAMTAILMCKLTHTPLIFTTHASDVVILKKVPFVKQLVTSISRSVVTFTAVSQQTADKLLRFIVPAHKTEIIQKMHIIPMGTNAQPVMSDTVLQSLRDHYSLNGRRVILFIGRIVKRKGVDDLIRAFAQIVPHFPDLKLVIAGDGQQKPELEALCAELRLTPDQVVFTGYASGDLKYGMLNIADIVCLPSINEGDHSEGLPVVFMEALAAGKTVVASDVSGVQEHVTDGANGFLFPQKDVAQLAVSLSRALMMDVTQKQQFDSTAHALSQQFEWPRIANLHYDLFVQELGKLRN